MLNFILIVASFLLFFNLILAFFLLKILNFTFYLIAFFFLVAWNINLKSSLKKRINLKISLRIHDHNIGALSPEFFFTLQSLGIKKSWA